jgi:hypothetical protein
MGMTLEHEEKSDAARTLSQSTAAPMRRKRVDVYAIVVIQHSQIQKVDREAYDEGWVWAVEGLSTGAHTHSFMRRVTRVSRAAVTQQHKPCLL